jgi:hypothetical protein
MKQLQLSWDAMPASLAASERISFVSMLENCITVVRREKSSRSRSDAVERVDPDDLVGFDSAVVMKHFLLQLLRLDMPAIHNHLTALAEAVRRGAPSEHVSTRSVGEWLLGLF